MVLFSYRNVIQEIFERIPFINEKIFSQAIGIEFAKTQDELESESNELKKFREDQLKFNKPVSKALMQKANIYINNLYIEINKFPKIFQSFIVKGLIFEKMATSLIDKYYRKHEFEIISVSNSQDEKQKNIIQILKEIIIKNKMEFRLHILKQRNFKLIKYKSAYKKLTDLILEKDKILFLIAINLEKFGFSEIPLQNITDDFINAFKIKSKSVYDLYQESAKKVNFHFFNYAWIISEYFSNIFDQAEDQSFFESFISNPQESFDSLLKDFNIRYADRTDCHMSIHLPSGKELFRTNLSSEIEFSAFEEQNKEKKQIQIEASSNILKRILQGDITTLYLLNDIKIRKIPACEELPRVANGILGYSSNLDLELAWIHQQIVQRQIKRIIGIPTLTLDNTVSTGLERMQAIEIKYHGEVTGNHKLKETVKDIEELMTFYEWSSELKEQYRHESTFQSDKETVNAYYEFRALHEKFIACDQRINEYKTQIDGIQSLLIKISSKAKSYEIQANEKKLELFQDLLLQDNEIQESLYLKIFKTQFVKSRIIKLLQNTDTWRDYLAESDEKILEILKNQLRLIIYAISYELYQWADGQDLIGYIPYDSKMASSVSSTVALFSKNLSAFFKPSHNSDGGSIQNALSILPKDI